VTVKDPADLALFLLYRLLMLLGQELTKILSKNKEIMTWEIDIVPKTLSRIIKQDLGLGAFKRQTEQRLTVAFRGNRGEKSKCLLPLYDKER
jgi:hypothetical protein